MIHDQEKNQCVIINARKSKTHCINLGTIQHYIGNLENVIMIKGAYGTQS